MKSKYIVLTMIFCGAAAGSLLHFSTPGGFAGGKIEDRVDESLPMAVLPSGKPGVTVLYKTNYSMPEEIRQALATAWIDKARAERHDAEIADIVENQQIEPCDLPGRVRMADGNCWRPELWKRLNPDD